MKFDDQPKPISNDQPAVWALVMSDMAQRNAFGVAKYGTPLQPFNGRDVLQDAYEEALDLCVYLRQAIYERENQAKRLASFVVPSVGFGGQLDRS